METCKQPLVQLFLEFADGSAHDLAGCMDATPGAQKMIEQWCGVTARQLYDAEPVTLRNFDKTRKPER
ncbi:MAG TPA: hypothetical protein VFJ15_10850 [Oleiagrimonas sp.]|nr:hypothetical protein [Oleiagrimonas sp.]